MNRHSISQTPLAPRRFLFPFDDSGLDRNAVWVFANNQINKLEPDLEPGLAVALFGQGHLWGGDFNFRIGRGTQQ